MATEPVCIRRTNTIEEADIIIAWLEEQGVEATVPDRDSTGVLAFGVTDAEGIEIFVANQETADRAAALLERHDQERAAASSVADGTLEVKCEACGEINRFPAGSRESVQECSKCGAYLDAEPGDQ